MTTTRPRMANLFVHGERLLVEKNDFLVIFQRGPVDLLVLLDATAHKDLPARAQHCLIIIIIFYFGPQSRVGGDWRKAPWSYK